MNSHIAEQAVLGSVLIDPVRFADIADKLEAADFQVDANREFWNVLVVLDKAEKPLDLVSVGSESGLWDYAKELHKNTPTSANIEHYAEMVRDASLERKLLVAGSEVMEIAKSRGDIQEKLDAATTRIMAVAETKSDDGPKAAKEYLSAWFTAMEEKINRNGDLIGVSTGLADLDKITAGLQATDLIIVAGRPSMGKTTLALNFAEQVSIKDKKNALVFSLEMSAEQLINRMVASVGTINQTNIRLAELDESEWGAATQVTGQINQSGLVIDETAGLTILDIKARARRVHRKTPLSLIVVDYIQLMEGRGDNQNVIVSAISRGLKSMAKELQVPVVALSQLNRSLEQRTNKRPIMSDLRDSGAIEQDADLVLFVYRDEIYDRETKNIGVAELIIAKQRNGETGMIPASFQGQYCRFKNYIGEIYQSEPQGGEKWKGGFSA